MFDEDSRHNNSDSIFGSADFSHNTSSSNSPVTCRGECLLRDQFCCRARCLKTIISVSDASDRQGRSASLSSDDVISLSQSQPTLSRSSTLPYDQAPQRAQPQRGGVVRTKTRSSSPGSEMVTLEEFLHESNLQSPPVVRNGSFYLNGGGYKLTVAGGNQNIRVQTQNLSPRLCFPVQVSTGSREDLMTDYFTRSPAHSTPAARDQVTPTSYVTPTVQSSSQRPGQSVKPSPRQPVGQSPASSQAATQRGSQSLSRAFSLASADLLRSNGPDSFRGNDGSPSQADVVVRRQGGGANGRERPLSARFASAAGHHTDGGFLNPTIHHSTSLNLQAERYAERERDKGGRTAARNGPSSQHNHRGEVAMVTPVRATPAARPDEASEPGDVLREGRSGDPAHSKKDGDKVRSDSAERPKSTPASPDPNNDPQTVWYEYGCV